MLTHHITITTIVPSICRVSLSKKKLLIIEIFSSTLSCFFCVHCDNNKNCLSKVSVSAYNVTVQSCNLCHIFSAHFDAHLLKTNLNLSFPYSEWWIAPNISDYLFFFLFLWCPFSWTCTEAGKISLWKMGSP